MTGGPDIQGGETPSDLHHPRIQGDTEREWVPALITPPGSVDVRRYSGRSVASLTFALAALPISWFPFVNLLAVALAIPGLVLGIKGTWECKQAPGLKGTPLAIAGATIAALALLLFLTVLSLFILEFILSRP